tara:strand:- start:458 stop:652 length:195 start_codon:yes stop_codon:yes gene_type:complete
MGKWLYFDINGDVIKEEYWMKHKNENKSFIYATTTWDKEIIKKYGIPFKEGKIKKIHKRIWYAI